jgi:hypothetical protein
MIQFKIAQSIKYGKYKVYKDKIYAIMDLIDYNEPLIREMLDLPDRVCINFRPLSRSLNGRYSSLTQQASVNCKLTPRSLMKTLFHELVHAEQYKTGKLKRELCLKRRRYVSLWAGQEYDFVNYRKNYDKYRSLPWEVEAFGRESELLVEFLGKAMTP